VLDLLIRDVTVVDGTGAHGFAGSVGVSGDRIVWIGGDGQEPPEAGTVIHGGGRTLVPGFVDVHNHSDCSPFVLPEMPSTIRQGTTTVVVGNCGSSPWPLAGWDECVGLAYANAADHRRPAWTSWGDDFDAIDTARPAVNVAALIGHGTVRTEVLGLERRPPTAVELDRMAGLVRDAVASGAVGVSSGLVYVPGMYAATDELVAVARASAAAGGLYASHIRGEGRDLFDAVDEAIRIGAEAELPVHVSHLKCESSRVWGRAPELLERIHTGGATGDQYPYAAWNSSLASLLPPWAPVAGVRVLAGTDGVRLRTAVEQGEPGFQSSVDGVGWDRIVISDTIDPTWNGRDVAAIAGAMGCDPFAAMVTLLDEAPDTSCIGHAMRDDDVTTILADASVFVASDASAIDPMSPAGSLPVHPRDYGTFPRALARARDDGLLTIERIVAKMTSLPADRFGLAGRGRIADGSFADLVLLDAGEVRDTASYEAPHAFPTGIAAVWVNGGLAWEHGATSVARHGRAIRRS
jgi:N-acyl-D-aspartate/D-glutamate deacylase